MKKEWKKFAWLIGVFVAAYLLPLGNPKVKEAIFEAFRLLQWYAREHTLACVVPALFIAGAITTFLSQASVMRCLGPKANKLLAYSVASVSGCVLGRYVHAVCFPCLPGSTAWVQALVQLLLFSIRDLLSIF